MAADTPGTTPGSYLNMSKVARTIEGAIYDKARFLPLIKEYERGYNQLTVRKLAAASGGTIGSTDNGSTSVSFQQAGLAPVTMSPTWLYVAHEFPDSMMFRGGEEIAPAVAENAEDALTAYLEYTLLQNLAVFTSYVGDGTTDMDAALFRNAVASLFNTGKVEAVPGESTIYGILGALQHDDIMSIPEFTHADQRGGGETPLVKGMVSKGNGVNMHFSTLCYGDGTKVHGAVWVRRAIGYYFNKRIGIEKQRYIKSNRVIADCEIASNVVYDALGVGLRHKLT